MAQLRDGTGRDYFRSWPLGVPQKADYEDKVRQAVLDRVLLDGLNVERTRQAMRRDFLLELSSGFVYDCLDAELGRLNQAAQRARALKEFGGVLCIDELHLGGQTLLLATDPLADRVVGFLLVKANDQPHMRRLLLMLNYWGFVPRAVVTDGSNLYPAVRAEVWPAALHQLCVFLVLQDVHRKILDAVRRLRRQPSRRGNSGRKRRRGRPSRRQQARRKQRGPTAKEKAAFVFKHRFLVVKRTEHFTKQEWDGLVRMFDSLPDLRVLWRFCGDVYQRFDPGPWARVARRRRALLVRRREYQAAPEWEPALGLLEGEKFAKRIAFLDGPVGQRVRTNKHVERANHQIRFAEKARYRWRSVRSLDRFLRLRLGRLADGGSALSSTPRPTPNQANVRGEVSHPSGD